MLVKIILVFLTAMVLLALIGRAFFPSALPRVLRKRNSPAACPSCGRYLLGQKGCDCGGKAR